MKTKNIIMLVISLAVCQLAGFIGSIFNVSSIPTWYETLNKPSFNPPNWIFAPVWTTLFVLMGISLYLVWSKGLKKKGVKSAVYVFGGQLALNTLWSILFFGLRSPTLAFVEIIILWLAILWTIIKFYKISKTAAYLLIPYIAWVSFAVLLNFVFVLLN
ncbi:tryptophan-rich sensory protein [Candidatus Woesearchaeota archaeon]|nr:tryptophan-rich sensory protein [Candidatus Woesearchaeota archaeon]